ncbi:MAG: integron integrase, partial [Gammaproteobacteria bacterium]
MENNVAVSTQNQGFNALVFLYKHVLHPDFPDDLKRVCAHRPPRLPVVSCREEVADLLACIVLS